MKNQYTRKTITDLTIRIAKDSGYKLNYIDMIQLTAATLKIHPFTVYVAIGSLDTAKQIADGTHSATKTIDTV